MKKMLLMAALYGATAMLTPTAASAYEVSMDDVLCPITTLGDEQLEDWGKTLADTDGELSIQQELILTTALMNCAEEKGWSETGTQAAQTFNISMLGSAAIKKNLNTTGIDPESYEVVLENRSPEELQQFLNEPASSPVLQQLAEMIKRDLGDNSTDKIVEKLASYVAFSARAQLAAMAIMTIEE
jgi:hypothetical protein